MVANQRLIRTVRSVMPAKASVVEKSQLDGFHILEVQLSVPGMKSASVVHRLSAAWVGEGWPKQIKYLLQGNSVPDVIVGRHVSPGARELAASQNVGWIEESGAAEFVTGSGLVVRTEPRVVQASASLNAQLRLRANGTAIEGKWSPAMLATAEALLLNTRATVEAVKEVAGLSTGATVRALRELTDRGLLSATATRGRNSERHLHDFDAFLDMYQRAAHLHRVRLATSFTHVLWRDPVDHIITMSKVWDSAGIRWAATGALAAQSVAPYLTDVQTVEIYVSDATTPIELDNIAAMIGGEPSSARAARLVLRPFPTTTSKRHIGHHGNLAVVPIPRLYADLFEVGVRGGEAAEHLKEVTNLGRTS